MSKYKEFNPYQLTSFSDLNTNFNLVKNDITSTAPRQEVDCLMQGNINFDNKTITGLLESNISSNATIFSQLPNYYKIISTPQTSINLDGYKTIIFTTVSQTTSATNPLPINITIDTTKPNYIYTFIVSPEVTDITISLIQTNGTATLIDTIKQNCTKSFYFNNGSFYPYNNSFNTVYPNPVIPANRKVAKTYNSPIITTSPSNNPIIINNENIGDLTNIKQVISITLNILSLVTTNQDNSFVIFAGTNSQTASYFTGTRTTSNVVLNDNIPYNNYIINSSTNLFGPNVNGASSTYFSFTDDNYVNYEGFGTNNEANIGVGRYYSYGGKFTKSNLTNLITFYVITKTLGNVINSYSNSILNRAATSQNISTISYNYNIMYYNPAPTL